MSLLSAAIWSSRDCFSRLYWCAALDSALRSEPSSSSAFSFRSSRTSRMLELFDLYAAAAGGPMSSSSLAEFCCCCTRAASFDLSAPLKEAASTMVARVCTRLFMLTEPICASAAGFFCIWRSMMVTARDRASMESMSSASLAVNSAASLPRMPMQLFRSAELAAMVPARSSILAVAAEASLVILSIEAARSSFLAVAVLISKPLLVVASSHQSTNSL
mmetsp:Transcript_50578/g.110089  ORF Transcript_50578/g.110089 Transcript_50578/m.110089 type:complete len:218 (+) Transcript_50578:380-1033(+)